MRYNFTTPRLTVKEWHSFQAQEFQELQENNLTEIVEKLLTPHTTKEFPIMWRGDYNKKRASFWIDERDSEATTLLAIERKDKRPIGLLHFFETREKNKKVVKLRLGYLVCKNTWGRGYATELLKGFVSWCKVHNEAPLTAAVNPDNKASIQVLKKNGFTMQKKDTNGINNLFVLDIFS